MWQKNIWSAQSGIHVDVFLILQQKLGSTTSLVARLLESHTHDGEVSYQDIQEIKGAASVLYAGELYAQVKT